MHSEYSIYHRLFSGNYFRISINGQTNYMNLMYVSQIVQNSSKHSQIKTKLQWIMTKTVMENVISMSCLHFMAKQKLPMPTHEIFQ